MPTREDYPFVGKWGARVSPDLKPGLRSHLTAKPRPHPPTAKPLDDSRSTRAGRASKRPGFGR